MQRFSGGGNHFANFIEAVRKGDRGHLNAEVEVGHRSTAVCHVGNVSYRVGEVAPVDKQRAAVRDIPIFNEMYDRYLAHLAANEIDPNTSILGPWLEVDREHECFKDHAKANEIIHGWYREPYVVPDLG